MLCVNRTFCSVNGFRACKNQQESGSFFCVDCRRSPKQPAKTSWRAMFLFLLCREQHFQRKAVLLGSDLGGAAVLFGGVVDAL